MLLFMLVMTGIAFLICCGEAFYERDWPRETIKYFLVFAGCSLGWLLFVH